MEEAKDRVLLCRQCGKEFAFTISEQEHYKEKGWSEPRHCPQCRSARRKTSWRICSGCGAELTKEDPAYCSTCLDSIKREAENKLHEYQKRIEELESTLENAGEMERNLASVAAELEKSQQTNKELRDRVRALEVENLKLTEEKAPWHSLEASVQQLNEHFKAFQESYACDVDKLAGLLLEVQNALAHKRNASLFHRLRVALAGKSGRRNKGGGAGDTNERLVQNYLRTGSHEGKNIANTKDVA